MTRKLSFAVLLSAFAALSCGENAVQDITGPLATSRIKFFNFGAGAPGVHFYAGTAKITAISSTTGVESVTGTAQGAAGLGGFYSALEPGAYAFTAKIAATVDKDLTISTVNATLEAGKFYSFFTSGIYDAAAKRIESFVIEDPVPASFDFTTSQVRFVNAIPNSTPQVLYIRNTVTGIETAVGSTGVAYKSGSAFVPTSQAVYDLSVRSPGSTTNLYVRTGVSFNAGRVYTVTGRGDMTVTLATSANRPQLDNTANR
jgi:hypothetical protein